MSRIIEGKETAPETRQTQIPITKSKARKCRRARPANSDIMNELDFGRRYLQKMRGLMPEGAHLERTNDLLVRIKAKLPQLEELLAQIEDRSGEEDGVYRFYHQSLKVFDLQKLTMAGLKLIEEIGGETDPPHPWYCQIVKEGTGHQFELSMNDDWLRHTRPILEAFWHTKYFTQMMIKYGKELETAPQMLPFGWAAVLWLFELR
jgi:hypothetical protein